MIVDSGREERSRHLLTELSAEPILYALAAMAITTPIAIIDNACTK